MSYAAISDLENRLTQEKLIDLSDFNGTGLFDTAAQARAQAALDDASATIDSYCGGRYQLPLQASQQMIDKCVDLAVYKLYLGRQRKYPDPVKEAYADALKFLGDVSTGKATLAQATVAQTSEMNVVSPDHHDEIFSPHKLRGF